MRPETESIQALVKLPEYLQRADKNVDLRSGYMNLVEGSSISIETTATRKLKSAYAEIVVLSQDADLLSPPTPEEGQATEPVQEKTTPQEIPLNSTSTARHSQVSLFPLRRSQ